MNRTTACVSLILLSSALAMACGGGGEGVRGDAPDVRNVATATLPAELPEARIVGGGAIAGGGAPGLTYIVKSGDTLAGIASRFGIALEDLRAANPDLNPSAMSVGDVVRLPDSAAGATPQPEPTQPPQEEPTAVPTVAPPTNTPSSLGQTYIVQSGDIPVSIAQKFGITVEELLAANPGLNPTSMHAGDVVIIPPKAPETEPTPPA